MPEIPRESASTASAEVDELMEDPTIPTPVDVHGTTAWVIITRDQPLAALTMSYREAAEVHDKLGQILADHAAQTHDLKPDGRGQGMRVCIKCGQTEPTKPCDG